MIRHLHGGRLRSLKLEELCSEFEEQWNPGAPFGLAIDEFIARVESAWQHELATELVACDIELRSAAGQSPSREEYRKRFPGFESAIEDAFQWLEAEGEPATPDTLANLPTQLGDFRLIREIGRGGMGMVYEAVQESLGRRVAVKTLVAHTCQLPHASKRFARETRAIGALHHTNIVDVFGSGEAARVAYLAMQLVEGRSLQQVIRERQKTISQPGESPAKGELHAAARVGIQVARALEYAHQHSVLHRDIKPGNLLLDESGTVQVTDFGLAKLLQEEDDTTKTGDVVGTLRYLPPEAINGQWDERGDIYSLGVTLYELLTLRSAFGASDRTKIIDQISQGNVTRPRNIDPQIDRSLETVVLKAMAREPVDRYQTAGAMADDLQRILNLEPILARRAGFIERLWKWSRRDPSLAALWIVLMFVALVGVPVLATLWHRADAARAVAEQRETEAEQARELASAREYSSLIQLAQRCMEDGIASEALQLLESVASESSGTGTSPPQDRRDWEWFFLREKLDTSALTLRGHTGLVHFVAVSPDDTQIATVGGSSLRKNQGYAPGEVILWDGRTGTQRHVLPGDPSGVTGAAFSPDGSRLATISFKAIEPDNHPQGTIKIWDTGSGKLLRVFEQEGQYPRQLISGFYGQIVLPGIQYSDDGKWLVSWPEPVEIRDASSGEVVRAVPGATAALLPGGQLAVKQFPGPFCIYDLKSGERLAQKQSFAHLFHYAVDSAGTQLSSMFSQHVRLWNLSTLEYRDISAPEVHWGAITPDGGQIVFGDRRGLLHLLPLDRSRPERLRMGHQSTISHGVFTHNGRRLVTASHDETVRVWDLDGETQERVVETRLGSDAIGDIGFGNDGERVLFAASQSKGLHKVAGWQSMDASAAHDHGVAATYHTHWPRNDFAFSSDGRLLAAPAAEDSRPSRNQIVGFAESQRINIWASDSLKLLESIEVGLPEITCTAWSRDAAQLAAAGKNNDRESVWIYRLRGASHGDQIQVDGQPHIISPAEQGVSAMVFHPGGDRLAIGTSEGVVLYQLRQPEKLPKRLPLPASAAEVEFLDFSPRGDRLAAAFPERRSVAVYDVATGQLLYETPAPRQVSCVRFSPNGRRLAMVGYDSLVDFCDAKTGCRLLTLRGAKSAPGQIAFTPRVIFSPDGRRIATNDWQGRITVWETEE